MAITVTTGQPIQSPDPAGTVISDYTTLLIDAGEYSGRNDIAQLFPRFVMMTEAKINRVLRVAEMEQVDNLVLSDGDVQLPDYFLEVRQIVGNSGQQLRLWPLQDLTTRFHYGGGNPQGYAISGNVLSVRPASDQTVTIQYYRAIPPLTQEEPTNWLIQKAPDVYLYGVVEEIAIWSQDMEKASVAANLRAQAMQGLSLQDERARWSNGKLSIGGLTP